MKRRRVGSAIGFAIVLGVAGCGLTITAIGCNSGPKDDGANTAEVKESLQASLKTQDKHEAWLADLTAKAQKAEKQEARIAELEKQLAALKNRDPQQSVAPARNAELEAFLKELTTELRNRPAAPGPRPEPEAALKYMHGVAEAFLEATVGRNDQTMAASMTRSYKTSIGGDHKEGTPEYFKALQTWCFGRSGGPNADDAAVYKEWAIASEAIAPGAEEASFNGTLSGLRKGSFTMRVVKDKESGKFLVDFFSVKHE